MQDAYIVAAYRTPVARAKGVFKNTRPDDLLAYAIKGLLAKMPQIDVKEIEDVIVGCAMPEGAQGMNVARIGLLLADLPISVPGMTVNRFCSSGLQTIAMAAARVSCGDADMILAGGTESMSMIPMGGAQYEANPDFFTHNEKHASIAYSMGITAENVAKQWNISREAQDEFAYHSHQKALLALEKGYFKAEILPVEVLNHLANLKNNEAILQTKTMTQDDGARSDTSLEALAKLRPVFAINGTVTAGNSSQMSDGAGMVLVVSEAVLKRYNLKPLARMLSYSVAGVDPAIMGIGPIEAIPKSLKKAGLNLQDIDWIELNEAFAAQALAVIKDSKLDLSKINPQGGAIALGHPLGATGSIRAATLLHGLQRTQKKYGMITMCIGTGMGAAGIFENLQ